MSGMEPVVCVWDGASFNCLGWSQLWLSAMYPVVAV